MNVVAILSSLALVGITLYWIFVQSHHGALYYLAAFCAFVLFLIMFVPVVQTRRF